MRTGLEKCWNCQDKSCQGCKEYKQMSQYSDEFMQHTSSTETKDVILEEAIERTNNKREERETMKQNNGWKIKTYRKETLGMSQEALADMLGVSQPLLSQLEGNTMPISQELAAVLVEAGLDLNEGKEHLDSLKDKKESIE